MFAAMWFPDQTLHTSILAGLSLCHRQAPPFIGPYLRCTFAMQHHQFVCDTIATTTSLSSLVLHQLEDQDQLDDDTDHALSSKRSHRKQTKKPVVSQCIASEQSLSCSANDASYWSHVPKRLCRAMNWASVLVHPYLLLTYLTFAAYWH